MSGQPGLPAVPLLDLLDARAAEADMTVRSFCRDRFGRNADRTLQRWRAGGTVRRDVADEVCAQLGVHPTDLWPNEWNRVDETPPRFRRPSMAGEDWEDEAACKDVDPDIFFPPHDADRPRKNGRDLAAPARAICMTCPVFDPCFEFGLTQEFGIWASTTEDERRTIRRERGIRLAHELEDSA